MKKIYLLFASAAIVAALLCCSCQKERYVEELDTVEGSSEGVVRSISFSVDAFELEEGITETKSTYDASGNFYFAATDTVGIFPSKGGQVYFEIPPEYVGKQSVRFDGGGWALKESFSYWSYSPLVGDFYLKKDHIPVEYTDLTQNGNESLNHISPVDFLYTDQCTVQNGSLSFAYHRLNCILRPRVTLPAGTYSKIVIQAENDVFVSKGYYDLTADAPAIIGTEFTDHLTLNLENASFAEETAFVGNLMTAPVDISNMPIKIIIYRGNSPVYYYTYERTSTLKANTPYGLRCTNLRVYVDSESSANEAFANGFQSVEFISVPSGDIALELPQTTDDVSILFPDSESDISVSVSYPGGASSKPANVLFDGPDGSNIVINVPNSTVTLGSGDYNTVESTTAPNTLIIPEDVNICTLNLRQGSVVVYGHVDTFNCEDMGDKDVSTVTVNGTVDSFLEEEGVTIITPITSLSLDHDSIDVPVGESIELHPSWTPTYATGVELEWSSSDVSVATVSSSGVVQGVSAGNATITVSLVGNSSIFATCNVTVIASLENRVIYYTSTDGNIVTPYKTDVFGANIVSNEYIDGQGIMLFDGDVTSIGTIAFLNCSTLRSITIPNSVTSIGSEAFSKCYSLVEFKGKYASSDGLYLADSGTLIRVAIGSIEESFDIPDGIISIGDHAFENCETLISVELPETVVSIGEYAFVRCFMLSEIILPENVTTIKRGAFLGCKGLTELIIPDSVTTIGDHAFAWCSGLTNIQILGMITSIENDTFEGCSSLPFIILPESVTSIGNYAFWQCTSLHTFNIPEGVTSIGIYAFSQCSSLSEIVLPAEVTIIGIATFAGCSSLTSISCLSVVPPTLDDKSWGYDNDFFGLLETNNCLLFVPKESIDLYSNTEGWCDYADRIQAIQEINGHAYVDMGNGLKWATMNIGANSLEESGDYFAWGEVEPYYSSLNPLSWQEGKSAGYAWESYKFNPSGDGRTFTRYHGPSLTEYDTLLADDDAATVNWGSTWRMPTADEWGLLMNKNNYTWEWITDYKGLGINGYIVTSKVSGYEGNYIFLPITGYFSLNTEYHDSFCYYWSSSLDGFGDGYARCVNLNSTGAVFEVNGDDRRVGRKIRPVSD